MLWVPVFAGIFCTNKQAVGLLPHLHLLLLLLDHLVYALQLAIAPPPQFLDFRLQKYLFFYEVEDGARDGGEGGGEVRGQRGDYRQVLVDVGATLRFAAALCNPALLGQLFDLLLRLHL